MVHTNTCALRSTPLTTYQHRISNLPPTATLLYKECAILAEYTNCMHTIAAYDYMSCECAIPLHVLPVILLPVQLSGAGKPVRARVDFGATAAAAVRSGTRDRESPRMRPTHVGGRVLLAQRPAGPPPPRAGETGYRTEAAGVRVGSGPAPPALAPPEARGMPMSCVCVHPHGPFPPGLRDLGLVVAPARAMIRACVHPHVPLPPHSRI